MLRRQALTLGSLLLGAVTLGGWTLFKQKDKSPLLLSARDDTDGPAFARMKMALLCALRGSIKAEIDGTRATIEPHKDYAGYVEFGTYKMAPRAYMRPAADINEPKFIAAMEALAAHL